MGTTLFCACYSALCWPLNAVAAEVPRRADAAAAWARAREAWVELAPADHRWRRLPCGAPPDLALRQRCSVGASASLFFFFFLFFLSLLSFWFIISLI